MPGRHSRAPTGRGSLEPCFLDFSISRFLAGGPCPSTPRSAKAKAKDVIATTGELYRLFQIATANLAAATYEDQRQAYLKTHASGKRFRFAPTPAHEFLTLLMGTAHVEAAGLYELVSRYYARLLALDAPRPDTYACAWLLQEMRTALDLPASA